MQALVELMKINDIYKPCMPYLLEIIDEVYLPMEKEQIVKAVDSNFNYDNNGYPTLGEQYYNKTYNQ